MRYDTLILDALKELVQRVAGFVPGLLMAFIILVAGYLVAKFLRKGLREVFKVIEFDKITGKLGLVGALKKGGIDHKPAELLSSLVYWVVVLMTLLVTLKALGLAMVTMMLDQILAYIPHIVSGAMVLIMGMLLAKVVASLIHVVAVNLDVPRPEVLSRMSHYAIIIYVMVMFLKEIGFGSLFAGTHYTIFLGGIVFAFALAFGLAGKDVAARYLEVLKKNGK